MGSLDAHKDKDEIFHKIVDGDWKSLFPRGIYKSIAEWFARQKDHTRVAVRFTFAQPPNNERYAMYVVCNPKLNINKKAKTETVEIFDFQLPDEHPLSIPLGLYETPLFCMPKDLLKRILLKKKQEP